MDAGKSKKPRAWTRRLRRMWRPFLNKTEKAMINIAIAEQQQRTTGEIHVHVVARAHHGDVLGLAQHKFHALKLKPEAVLLLVSHIDHHFAIIGGEVLHQKLGQDCWNRAKDLLALNFAERRYAQGIEACVRMIGEELARQFPK